MAIVPPAPAPEPDPKPEPKILASKAPPVKPKRGRPPKKVVQLFPDVGPDDYNPRALEVIPTGRVREIQDLVCRSLKISRAELLSHRRTRATVAKRQIAMWLCKEFTPHSLPEIGRRFGDRDHTTVLHAIRRTEAVVNSAPGSRVSQQLMPATSDWMRGVIALLSRDIAAWPELKVVRNRYPSREGRS